MSIEIDILNADAAWPLAAPLFAAAGLPHGHHASARAELRVLIRAENDDVLCHAGLYRRTLTWNGRRMKVGGIGGLVTRPDSRRRGYATVALNAAIQTFRDEGSATFALTFCAASLVPFFSARGFKPFDGDVVAEQPGGTEGIADLQPMVHDIGRAPRNGTMDLCGPAW